MDTPLSQSSVMLQLEEIRKRCNELLEEPHRLAWLALEDAAADADRNDPYNRA